MAENTDLKPALQMRRHTLEELPPLIIPDGFTLRHYTEGDAVEWEKIIESSFKYTSDFDKNIKSHEFFKEERVKFICDGNKPVATAIAWCDEKNPEKTGYVHMVGAYSEYAGKKLGYTVTLSTLYQMKLEGRKDAVLHTDDFRLPALNVYIKLGFRPEIVHENQKKRWENIFTALNIKR